MAKEKSGKGKKVILILVCAVVIIAGVIAGANYMALQNLISLGNSYEKIEFENQLTPEKDENGNWYFTTDGDFKVMHLTDIHIGGGFMSKDVDEKAINAVATMVTREKLRPYILKQMDIASEKGYPVMRPMFFEYPADEKCYTLDSEYMFGDDIIFAPIVERGQTVKTVYIPDGEWILTKDKKVYTKGTYEITAEIDEFIAFVRKDSDVIECFR